MNTLHSMLQTHPQASIENLSIISEALHALALCEQVCLTCADACLAEESPESLRTCIRQDLDCATVCAATSRLLLRRTSSGIAVLHAQLHACVLACQVCADVCSAHAAHHEHCAVCARTCRSCQEKCNAALGEFSPAGLVQDEE